MKTIMFTNAEYNSLFNKINILIFKYRKLDITNFQKLRDVLYIK